MTLLCIDCHGRVTRRLISKKMVWNAKENPKALQNGFVQDSLFVNTDEMEIDIGNSKSKNCKAALTIHGKPIIWFEPPLLNGEPSKVCAIFNNDNSMASSYINRNQFIGLTNNQDIKSESTILDVVAGNTKCLQIDREGDEVLKINKMQCNYLGLSISLDATGALKVKHGISDMTISSLSAENCGTAMNFGEIPSINKYNKLDISIKIATIGVNIFNINSTVCGWLLGNELINKSYFVVGYIKNEKAYSVSDEFIGYLSNGYITYNESSYDSGEPILITNQNRVFKIFNPMNSYDLSFRLFGRST